MEECREARFRGYYAIEQEGNRRKMQRPCITSLPCFHAWLYIEDSIQCSCTTTQNQTPTWSSPKTHALLCDPASCNHLCAEHFSIVSSMSRKCQLILFVVAIVIFNNFITTAFLGLLITFSHLATSRTLTTPEIDVVIIIIKRSGLSGCTLAPAGISAEVAPNNWRDGSSCWGVRHQPRCLRNWRMRREGGLSSRCTSRVWNWCSFVLDVFLWCIQMRLSIVRTLLTDGRWLCPAY